MEENKSPKWREDFPFESENDDIITRRDFVRFLTLVSGGLAVGNTVFLFSENETKEFPKQKVCGVNDLAPGSWMVFHYPEESHPAILAKLESGHFVSFGQKCPHLACPVMYHKADEEEGECLTCHCHNGRFDVFNGQGTKGPPLGLRALTKVVLQIENNTVYAVGLNIAQGVST